MKQGAAILHSFFTPSLSYREGLETGEQTIEWSVETVCLTDCQTSLDTPSLYIPQGKCSPFETVW